MNTKTAEDTIRKSDYAPGHTSVCVLGLGYIGLPTASVLATKGFQVHGMDVRSDVVETINQGRIHIEEPDLDILVRSAVNSGQLKAGHEPQPADVFFICVPTPIRPDHTPDVSYVEQASKAIKPHVKSGDLIILESTSPPQTTEKVVIPNAVPDGMTVGEDVFVLPASLFAGSVPCLPQIGRLAGPVRPRRATVIGSYPGRPLRLAGPVEEPADEKRPPARRLERHVD